jgi:hypothetical protein
VSVWVNSPQPCALCVLKLFAMQAGRVRNLIAWKLGFWLSRSPPCGLYGDWSVFIFRGWWCRACVEAAVDGAPSTVHHWVLVALASWQWWGIMFLFIYNCKLHLPALLLFHCSGLKLGTRFIHCCAQQFVSYWQGESAGTLVLTVKT